MGAMVQRMRSAPSPLLSAEARLLAKADAGEGWGGGYHERRCSLLTPTPDPSPQGGGGQSEPVQSSEPLQCLA